MRCNNENWKSKLKNFNKYLNNIKLECNALNALCHCFIVCVFVFLFVAALYGATNGVSKILAQVKRIHLWPYTIQFSVQTKLLRYRHRCRQFCVLLLCCALNAKNKWKTNLFLVEFIFFPVPMSNAATFSLSLSLISALLVSFSSKDNVCCENIHDLQNEKHASEIMSHRFSFYFIFFCYMQLLLFFRCSFINAASFVRYIVREIENEKWFVRISIKILWWERESGPIDTVCVYIYAIRTHSMLQHCNKLMCSISWSCSRCYVDILVRSI